MAEERIELALRSTLVRGKGGPSGQGPVAQSVDDGDPFKSIYGTQKGILTPPYDTQAMVGLKEKSDQLGNVLESYVTVVERMGYTLERTIPPGSDEPLDVDEEELLAERQMAETLMMGLTEDSLEETRARSREDRLMTGGRFFEVIRDPQAEKPDGADPLSDAMPVMMEHIPAATMRLTSLDPTRVRARRWRRNAEGEWEAVYRWRRFRKFVQKVGGQFTWFKEFGDPRHMDCNTGEWVSEDKAKSLAEKGELATEVIHDRHYSSRTPYGVSPFAGTILDISTNWKVDEQNWLFFENGLKIPMVLMVSGGMLTEESRDRLKEDIQALGGTENWNEVLILEAVSPEGADPMEKATKNSVQMKLEPGKQFSEEDGLHQNLKANNDAKIRQVLRVPPILTGSTPDYNFATAFASLLMFELMVAVPARKQTDNLFNELLFPEYNIRHWKVRSKGVKVADFADVAKIVDSATEAGAITPNEVRSLVSKMLDVDLPPFDPEELPWAGTPIRVAQGGEDGPQNAARAAVEALVFAFEAARTRKGPQAPGEPAEFNNETRPL